MLAVGCRSAPGQVANSKFEPDVDQPTVASTSAPPTVCIDEGHHNFHTLEGRYAPFAEVLRADGYRVTAAVGELRRESLTSCDVLVIANTLQAVRRDQTGAITRSRPLCQYPLVARYKGQGSTDQAASFECRSSF
jgi:hypothetical protein